MDATIRPETYPDTIQIVNYHRTAGFVCFLSNIIESKAISRNIPDIIMNILHFLKYHTPIRNSSNLVLPTSNVHLN